ncbi:MAG: valine--tRNA ligase [Arsenophonus sp.]|nr:MAG: valine--tRNA ligase [Arsenophonus sp.]
MNKTKKNKIYKKTSYSSLKKFEQNIYKKWELNGFFKPTKNKKENFCIVIPPPNITGSLHLGHAFQQTIMDILIRYNRMQGKNTLWQSGIDHAGIAAQILLENKILIKEKKNRYNLEKKEFKKKMLQWKQNIQKKIFMQMKRLGNSIDWTKKRFTMDKDFQKSVKKAFISLYEDKLIYRGKKLVNWDPKLRTAISDLEIENKKTQGFVWHIQYQILNQNNLNYISIATTRPETILGDTALAVNPNDIRYQKLIGKTALVPLINRIIPIISDKSVDINQGTGCMKITPAHDFTDYEIAKRHKLPMINILDSKGNILKKLEIFDSNGNKSKIFSSNIPLIYQKINRFSARKIIIEKLKEKKLLTKIEKDCIILPYSDRGGVVVEPMLTDQWYLKVSQLKEKAIDIVKNGSIKFIPKEYENIYFSWMNIIQDWCISRQIWWGHPIPAWYDKNGNIYVGNNLSEIRKKYKLHKNILLKQDPDVLDTWFSSSLWTFSVLGWPKNTSELKQFHPTNVLVSGFDIIFFWISRMIMLTLYFIKDKHGKSQIPFKHVYITALVRDENKQKMSKFKGNVIDPIDMIDGISLKKLLKKRTNDIIKQTIKDKIIKNTKKTYPNGIPGYGTDALRFTLASLSSANRNVFWNMNKLVGYRNFCNKLWNASQYILNNVDIKINDQKTKIVFSDIDLWVVSKLNNTIKTYRHALDNYRFDIATNILYHFIWNEFCDWYLELSKIVFKQEKEKNKIATQKILIETLEKLLRLAHPIIPFITEIIWQKIKKILKFKENTIMITKFPKYNSIYINKKAEYSVKWIKKIIVSIRNIRKKMKISFNKPLKIFLKIKNKKIKQILVDNIIYIKFMGNLINIKFLKYSDFNHDIHYITFIDDEIKIIIPKIDLINKNEALNLINKKINKIKNYINLIQNKLKNNNFLKKAPSNIIQKTHDLLEKNLKSYTKLKKEKKILKTLKN